MLADHRRHLHPDAQGRRTSRRRPPTSLKFFDWAYKNGDKTADDLDYVPMPDRVKARSDKPWAAEIKDASGKAVACK